MVDDVFGHWVAAEGRKEHGDGDCSGVKGDYHCKVLQGFEEDEKNCETGIIEWLEPHRNNVSVHLSHTFVRFQPRREVGDEDWTGHATIVPLARLDSRIEIVASCLTKMATHGEGEAQP